MKLTDPGPTLRWLDQLKGIALIWIVLNHVAEQLYGYPWIANPSAAWPPLSERLAQLAPLTGEGFWDLPRNLLRYVGWSGDQGVQLFLILSGFGLSWGLLRSGPCSAREFYRKRLLRIYPLWIFAHIALFALGFLLSFGELSPTDPRFLMSLAGLRLTPGTLYYGSPAWWYIGLLLQLYAVFPLLWWIQQRIGAGRLLVAGCLAACLWRAAAIYLVPEHMDALLRGMLFPARLPEFLFGMWLARRLAAGGARALDPLRRPAALLAALAVYAAATALALDFPGMVVAPALHGVCAFLLFQAVLARADGSARRELRPLVWIGRHSYSLYLFHQFFILLLVSRELQGRGPVVAATAAAVALSVITALAAERLVRWRARGLAALGLLTALALIGGEAAVRHWDPQEVLGWGERPALEPDPNCAYRLRPARTTRLRWEGYDYVVQSSSLGFPGPGPAAERPPGGLRIMVLGDAFSSAEGVDTDAAWPRLLETELSRRTPERSIEVLNFAITGHGPNQYAAVLREHGARLQPDLVLIGFFVNDYLDALMSDEDFRASIGFGQREPGSPGAWLRLVHLRRMIELRLMAPLRERLTGEPASRGYHLANLRALERGNERYTGEGYRAVARRLGEIRSLAEAIGARVLIAMIPAPPQVAAPEELDYFPYGIDLSDETRWDLEQPQRMTRALAAELGLICYDLRPTLRAVEGEAVYFPFNMHWTPAAHRAVAAYLAGRWAVDGWSR